MAKLTRRAWMVGAGGAALLGCGGFGRESGGTGGVVEGAGAASKAKGKAPAGRTGVGEPGTLFPVALDEELPRIQWAETPPWFRAAPSLWCPSPRSAGSNLLTYSQGPEGALCRRISHWRELPKLLEQARRVGTDVLYLVDWYQGARDAACENYVWNKGDYEPREDFGGEQAMIDGIRAVQEAGGRVILYLEAFVIGKESKIGRQKGEAWALKREDGHPDQPYPRDWKLCPAVPEFREYLTGVAGRIASTLGADGLHIDSYGIQRGWKCVDPKHGHPPGDGQVFDEGALELVAGLLKEMRKHKPEAILMCEGSKLQRLYRTMSSSQEWGIHDLAAHWIWRSAGEMAVFTSGWSLDDVHQVLALGHKLSISSDWPFERPKGTCEAALRDLVPGEVPDKPDDNARRYFAEDLFLAMHRFRNAGILLGRAVPNIDACTPRRWLRQEAFESHAGLVALVDECRSQARDLDVALAGAGELPSLEAHYQQLTGARAALERAIKGATIKVLDTGEAHVAAYAFDGPNGKGATCVSVDTVEVQVPIRVQDGAWRELVEGGTSEARGGSMRARMPPHSLRMWIKT